METVSFDGSFADWQQAARRRLLAEIPPHEIAWQPNRAEDQPSFFSEDKADSSGIIRAPGNAVEPARSTAALRVPRRFMEIARTVACHRDDVRWVLLYRALWRITHGEAEFLANTLDPDVIALGEMAKSVGRDIHKMRAFVRFREIATDEGSHFIAWFEPHHNIVEANAPFFVERFAHMTWSILTPNRCAHWDQTSLSFTPGVSRDAAPAHDAREDLWRTYYASIFNPARVKVNAMKKEMPAYYWQNLPEAALIPGLLAEASTRTTQMVAASRAKPALTEVYGPAPVPDTDELDLVREAAKTCRACPLWQNATCTVFGEGPEQARVVVVGEQPGDQEDLAGKPFVGPAGKLFDRALAAAGVDRTTMYVTNAVKHFKWKPQGKRRLHQKPSAREVAACRPWLAAELKLIRPQLIVCLGGTAAESVVGPGVKVLEDRGQIVASAFGIPALLTVHPSSLLRQPDLSRRNADFSAFVADLARIADGAR